MTNGLSLSRRPQLGQSSSASGLASASSDHTRHKGQPIAVDFLHATPSTECHTGTIGTTGWIGGTFSRRRTRNRPSVSPSPKSHPEWCQVNERGADSQLYSARSVPVHPSQKRASLSSATEAMRVPSDENEQCRSSARCPASRVSSVPVRESQIRSAPFFDPATTRPASGEKAQAVTGTPSLGSDRSAPRLSTHPKAATRKPQAQLGAAQDLPPSVPQSIRPVWQIRVVAFESPRN